jgi:hypothetical protein
MSDVPNVDSISVLCFFCLTVNIGYTRHRTETNKQKTQYRDTVKSGVPSVASFSGLSSSCVLCTRCCQFLWIVHFWLPLRYSLTFIYISKWNHQYTIYINEYKNKTQHRETGNIGYTRRRKTKQKHNTICVGHHYAQTHTNNVNKTWTLLQTTGDICRWFNLYIANNCQSWSKFSAKEVRFRQVLLHNRKWYDTSLRMWTMNEMNYMNFNLFPFHDDIWREKIWMQSSHWGCNWT